MKIKKKESNAKAKVLNLDITEESKALKSLSKERLREPRYIFPISNHLLTWKAGYATPHNSG